MGRLTPDEFRAKYAALPPNLREAYGSVNTSEILEEIGKKHGLHIDDVGGLVNETGYVMLGVTPPGEYIKKLADAIDIPREKAREIAIDVNERVFKPIREALKRVHRIGEYKNAPPFTAADSAREAAKAAKKMGPRSVSVPIQKEDVPEAVHTMAEDIARARGGAAPSLGGKESGEQPPSRAAAPAPSSAITGSLSEERLTKPFSLPSQEKSYTLSGDGEPLPDKNYGVDPYREPVE